MWGVTLRSPGQVFSPQSWLQETHQDSIRVSQVLKCQLNITTTSPPNHQHPISVVVVLKQPESFKFPPLYFQTTAAYTLVVVADFPSPEPLPIPTAVQPQPLP